MNRRRCLVPGLTLILLLAGLARGDVESERLAQYRKPVDIAVRRALSYLARQQAAAPVKNGSFPGAFGTTNAIPALVAMAFLSKGYTPGSGPYGQEINRCLDYILSHKPANGYLNRGGRMYGHGIATLFLSEVSGMVDQRRQRQIDALLPLALRVILDAQKVTKQPVHQGGWRYEPHSRDSDLSLTGWSLMALRSAKLNGAPVPDKAIADAGGFVRMCWKHDGRAGDHLGYYFWANRARQIEYVKAAMKRPGGFGYMPYQDRYLGKKRWCLDHHSATLPMTGVGLLCLELTGHHGDVMTTRAGDTLLRHLNNPTGFIQCWQHEYGTYYCSQGMFQLGGRYWETFGEALYKYLLPRQLADGSWKGSNGPVYPTAMYTLALTVSYRQLPIYQR
jgi:hypothetical protein